MGFDINKPYQTRDGKMAEVIQGPNGRFYGYCYADYNTGPIGGWWHEDGRYQADRVPTQLDLVNIPEKRTVKVWINVYPGQWDVGVYPSKDSANECAGKARIACIERELSFEVGEGL